MNLLLLDLLNGRLGRFDDCQDGADVDLLTGVTLSSAEHAVGRRGDGVLHLHRLQPDQRLTGRDGVTDLRAEPDDVAGHGRHQRSLLDGRTRLGKPWHRVEMDRPARRIDVDFFGHNAQPRSCTPPRWRRPARPLRALTKTRCTGSSPASTKPVLVNRYSTRCSLSLVVAVGLDLVARRQVSPATGHRAEYGRGDAIVRGVGERGGNRRQTHDALRRPAVPTAAPGRACRKTRCRSRRRGMPDAAARSPTARGWCAARAVGFGPARRQAPARIAGGSGRTR